MAAARPARSTQSSPARAAPARRGGDAGEGGTPGPRARPDAVPVRHALDARAVPQRLRRVPAHGRAGRGSVDELDPRAVRLVQIDVDVDTDAASASSPVDGIDYGVCVPRNLQDVQLVEAAREQGADVRERCSVERVLWRAGRAGGVVYSDADGARARGRAELVVGADGRRSTVAARGRRVARPTASRATAAASSSATWTTRCRRPRHAETICQWRDGDSFALRVPQPQRPRSCPVHGRRGRGRRGAQRTPRATGAASSREHPGCRGALAGATSDDEAALDRRHQAFFRASSGPGWALAGDAGHFKDPVTGQGMRDAMWMGRTLAEALRAGARRPGRDRPRHCGAGSTSATALPARLPLRQHRDARRAASRPSSASSCATPGRTEEPDARRPLRPRAHAAGGALTAAPRAGARAGAAPRHGTARAARPCARARPSCATTADPPRAARRPLPRGAARAGSDHPGATSWQPPAAARSRPTGRDRSTRAGRRREPRTCGSPPSSRRSARRGRAQPRADRGPDPRRPPRARARRDHRARGVTSPNVYAKAAARGRRGRSTASRSSSHRGSPASSTA